VDREDRVTRAAVLHISAAEGGGVDRYIRDIAANVRRRHFLWHVGSGIDVIEDMAAQRFLPLSRDIAKHDAAIAVEDWLGANDVGVVHLHGLGDVARERLALVQRAAAVPSIVTLHDLTFVNPKAFSVRELEADAAWIARISDTLTRAAAVIAPSVFIRDLVTRHFPPCRCEVLAPGIGPFPATASASVPVEFTKQRPKHVVAVIGAIGPHKGSALLDALVDRLKGTDIGMVVIGYTDSQILRGWRAPGRCYVHGPYVESELPALIAGYGVEVALFPNRLPESFSYTLSEVWAAGIPAIVPEDGALGERVSRHAGGWILPARYSAEDAEALLLRLFGPSGADERARVKSQIDPRDDARIPTLAAMARDIDALYERFGLKPSSTEDRVDHEALRPLLAANLDGFAFRRELIQLADEAVLLRAAIAEAKPWSAKLERDIREAQAWARKLEHDVDVLMSESKAQFEENRRLLDDKAAFDQLPLIVRKLLLKKAFRARR
jgi:glycosyltransferase involved in cell wall biosynthesis